MVWPDEAAKEIVASPLAIQGDEAAVAEILRKYFWDLQASLMVLDATIYMLAPGLRPEWAEMFRGQIAAAKDAYEHATGEESMIGFTRNQPTEKPCPTPRS